MDSTIAAYLCINWSPHDTVNTSNYGSYCSCTTNPQADVAFLGEYVRHCNNCLNNASGNPMFTTSYLTTHGHSGTFYDPFEIDPVAAGVKTFYLGPFYKHALTFHTWNSSYSNNSVFINDDCKANPTTGAYPNANCDPRSPKLAIDFNSQSGGALRIQVQLFQLRLHGRLGIDARSSSWIMDAIIGLLRGSCLRWLRGTTSNRFIIGQENATDFSLRAALRTYG